MGMITSSSVEAVRSVKTPSRTHGQRNMQAQANNSKADPSNAHSRSGRYGNKEMKSIQHEREREGGVEKAEEKVNSSSLRRRPTARNFNPFWKATALLAFHIHNVRIAPAPASHAVLLHRVGVRPVFIFLDARLFVLRRHLQPWDPGQLTSRGIGGTVLDSGVSVTKVPEIVDIRGGQEGASGERMDGSITPL